MKVFSITYSCLSYMVIIDLFIYIHISDAETKADIQLAIELKLKVYCAFMFVNYN